MNRIPDKMFLMSYFLPLLKPSQKAWAKKQFTFQQARNAKVIFASFEPRLTPQSSTISTSFVLRANRCNGAHNLDRRGFIECSLHAARAKMALSGSVVILVRWRSHHSWQVTQQNHETLSYDRRLGGEMINAGDPYREIGFGFLGIRMGFKRCS